MIPVDDDDDDDDDINSRSSYENKGIFCFIFTVFLILRLYSTSACDATLNCSINGWINSVCALLSYKWWLWAEKTATVTLYSPIQIVMMMRMNDEQ